MLFRFELESTFLRISAFFFIQSDKSIYSIFAENKNQ